MEHRELGFLAAARQKSLARRALADMLGERLYRQELENAPAHRATRYLRSQGLPDVLPPGELDMLLQSERHDAMVRAHRHVHELLS